jgi:hypothetical protein
LGTVTLTGNIFFGNTASDAFDIVCNDDGTTSSGGYNLTDRPTGGGSGFAFTTGDLANYDLPISPVNFRPLLASPAIGTIGVMPAEYPLYDYYGVPMSSVPLAKGAVQTAITSAGYWLDYNAVGQGAVNFDAGSTPFNEDGIYNPGSVVILEATAETDSSFSHWVLNDVRQPAQSPPDRLSFTMDANKTLRAVFSRNVTITSLADSGPGTLREALNNTREYDVISVDSSLSGGVIPLTSALPDITRNITIDGSGVTILGSGIPWASGSSGIMRITNLSSSIDVTIRRIHFTGRATGNAVGIITNNEKLTLESCIISGNTALNQMISSPGDSLTIRGCTFYNNTSNNGVIYSNACPITITGNIFYGNTTLKNIRWGAGYNVSSKYNISDKDPSDNGWPFDATDQQVSSSPISGFIFKPFAGGYADAKITTVPAEYPAYDFYGASMSTAPLAIGAVQATVAQGYFLDYAAQGSGTISVSGSPNTDGIYSPSSNVTLQAFAGGGVVFHHWTVNGVKQPVQSPPDRIDLTMDADKTVRAVFGRNVEVTSAGDSGPGTLRAALLNAQDYDFITTDFSVSGQTIILNSPLTITKSITLSGNGITLSGSGIPKSASSRILSVEGGTEVIIRRIHFKDGVTTGNGGAISNKGILNLESCIFSGNTASSGGVIDNLLYLGVKACTFYGNNSVTIETRDILELTGNIFYGNPAGIVYKPYGVVNSGGYNVSDGSAWGGSIGTDTSDITVLPLSPNSFKPRSGRAAAGKITAIPAGYPAEDFYGAAMTGASLAAGAVQTLAATGYYLAYGAQGNGTVSVLSGVDSDGMCSSGGTVTLQASPGGAGTILHYWSVDGVRRPAQNPASQFSLAVNADNLAVRAVFTPGVTVITSTEMALQSAFDTVPSGGVVVLDLPAGTTINLTTGLTLASNKDIFIEGNGVTLDGGSSNDVILYRYSGNNKGTITIRRVHFKNAKNGPALSILGQYLTVESCIFSGNKQGAIKRTVGTQTLTIRGCTFYNNSPEGVVQNDASLQGNLFYGNTMHTGWMLTSLGYNISDKPSGAAASGGSGWNFTTGDIQVSSQTLNTGTFRPSNSGNLSTLQIVPVETTDFPEVDFYGDPRANYASGGNTAAGAVSHN